MTLPPPVEAPCRQCPWRRRAARGWLGPHDRHTWVQIAHSDVPVACHMTVRADGSWEGARQCAGAASYRKNVEKRPRDPAVAVGPARDDVFASPAEFLNHHDLEGEK